MKKEVIEEKLKKHELYLNKQEGGERADFQGAGLRDAVLKGKDLHGADFFNANLKRANLSNSDLSCANLFRADLEGANLTGAKLDYSCITLSDESSHFKCDVKLVYQLLAQIYTLDFPDEEGIKELIRPFAIKSHRASSLDILRDK